MSTTGRVFRHIRRADLVNVSSGKLKAFWNGEKGKYYPAKLVSVKYHSHRDETAWIYEGVDTDVLCNSDRIVVDVTPVKRYALWNHKAQRFLLLPDHPTGDGFTSRQDAEIWRDTMFHESFRKNFYVVEWEIKEDM